MCFAERGFLLQKTFEKALFKTANEREKVRFPVCILNKNKKIKMKNGNLRKQKKENIIHTEFRKTEATALANQKKFTVRDLAEIGVLAALVFVASYFLKIGPIPTPAGPTQFKMGNAVCLLGALLFGKLKGGLASGIGSAMFDLTNPAFVASAPTTFINFFLMSFVCGWVSKIGGNDGTKTKRNIIAAICGAGTYLVLHLGKSFVTLLLEGSEVHAALVACGTKFVTSGINAVFAVVVSVILAPVCKKALDRAYRGR